MLLDLMVLLKTSKQTYLGKTEKSVRWRVLCGIQVRDACERAKLIGQATAQICYSVFKSVWPGFEKQTNMFVFGINLCSKVLLVDNSII